MLIALSGCSGVIHIHPVYLLLCRLVQAAAGVVAEVLLQTEDRSPLDKDLDTAARCVVWALDEGYMRCIISRGLALRRTQAKLASSSLSDSIPDLSPNMRPPAGMKRASPSGGFC